MPRGDGTGPLGLGPMTGRAAGYCAGYPVPGFMNPWVPGFGFGRGRGFRWRYYLTGLPGWVRWGYPRYYSPYYYGAPLQNADDQETFLREQAQILEEELNQIKEQIRELQERKKNDGSDK